MRHGFCERGGGFKSEVLKGYEEQLVAAIERLAKRPPAKPYTVAMQWNLFARDGPLTFTQVAGHTFGFMLWPLGAYYFGIPAVAAGLVGCALGIGARQAWAYALQIVGAPLPGVYRELRQCCRNAKEEGTKAGNKKEDQVVHVLPAWSIESQLGPVHTIFPRCVADQKGHAQGAKRSRGRPPARPRNAAHGLFGRNPKGMGWKQRHSSLHS
jgi:hypothetical protein